MRRFAGVYVTLMMLILLLLCEGVPHAGEKAPTFSLPQWGREKLVSLEDFQGQIVVLDFFSASCGICLRASMEVEIGIQEFYAERSGNPHGIAVQVVAINSDVAETEDMSVFIEETGLDPVLDDSAGSLLKRYGGAALPYLVVIDITGGETGTAEPQVVYRRSGYEGLNKLYRAIDAITGRTGQIEPSPGTFVDAIPEVVPSLRAEDLDMRITHETALDSASLIAPDIFVTEALAEYRQKRPSMELDLAISILHIEADYVSEYLDVRRERQLAADRVGVKGSTRFILNKTFTLTVGAGAYDGFQTYRALWLDEYYRHMFNVLREYIDNLKGYRKAYPWGYSISSGLRWEYLPDAGFAEGSISYQHDIVSPGYETGIPVIRLRDTYDTISGHLAFENVLTRRLRTLAEFQVDDTTDRDLRFTLQGSLNYAMAEHWVTRLAIAGSKEKPDFTAKSISAVLERDWYSTWFLNLFGRYYEDTSEIANAIAGNAAAPPLKTYQAGLGVRRQGNRSSFKFVVGPCFSRYQSEARRDRTFDQLYKDRDWLSVQAAFMHQF
ncbi:TlpA family protein disulfide reductase [Thermodesulfobacteriota bacterium]